jgi:pimeloyl-ACP methyl ester carboxylesterase
MTILSWVVVLLAVVVVIASAAVLLVVSSPLPVLKETDVFGFDALQSPPESDLPPLLRYPTRDGERLAYRFYDSSATQMLIFIHGSSLHGGSYHDLARHTSTSGTAKVVLPNLRGHFQSGRRRGDVEYIGQLEDDIVDLITELRSDGFHGPIVLGGHSGGGGLVIRFAGGANARLVARFLMLSPVIPTSPMLRRRPTGPWAQIHTRRIAGLTILNALGIRGLNSLPVIQLSKPVKFWDGTETLTYSYRLTMSYYPRTRYSADVRSLEDRALVLIGENDEAVDAQSLQKLFKLESPLTAFKVCAGMNHFGIFTSAAVHEMLSEWLMQRPETSSPS